MIGILLCAALVAGQGGSSLQINVCNLPKWQQWSINPTPAYHQIILKSTGNCIDVENYSTDNEATIWTFPCHPSDSHNNQAWTVNADGTITEDASKKCLDRSAYGTTPGTQVWLFQCTGAFNQQWVVNNTDGTIRAKDSHLCLDGGGPVAPPPRACDLEPGKSMPFCDVSLTIDARVASLVANLTVAEKIPLFANGAGGVPRLNIRGYQWWSEALHGVAFSPGVNFGGEVPHATSFAQVGLTAAAFNHSLWLTMGTVVGLEGRAMSNANRAGLTFWAPNINIYRDPRWGRGQETPGEDPFLSATYAANYVGGMQWGGNDKNYLLISSCCKHYTAYSLENWGGVDRHHFDAIVPLQDMTDTYMPAFESCVTRAKGSGLMCAYNSINGVPACSHGDYMNTLAREAWGFDGYVTGDCGAVDDVFSTHHYEPTRDLTVKSVLEAGLDIDCGDFIPRNLQSALSDGTVKRADVDTALHHLFRVQYRLGMFDPADRQPYMNLKAADTVDTQPHRDLALEAAQQGMTLLKNLNNKLPWSNHTFNRIAVIGPSADATGTMQGNYQGSAPYLISPFAGIKTYASASSVTAGCNNIACTNSDFSDAVTAARNADAVVLVVGIDQSIESEGKDRTTIGLPGNQGSLISQVARAAKGPVVVVLMAGGAVDISGARDDPNVDGIIWCGYPGQSGGQAIADVIFGTVNPAGRMPYTIYPADYVNQVSMFDMNMRPSAKSPGRSYRFYTGKAVYEFGYGLSYTTFSYENVTTTTQTVPLKTIEAFTAKKLRNSLRAESDVAAVITVRVKNTGTVAGATSVLGFVAPPNPGQNGAPLKTLVGFQRIFLKPGDTQTVAFQVGAHDLSLVDDEGLRAAQAGTWTMVIGQDAQLTIPIVVA